MFVYRNEQCASQHKDSAQQHKPSKPFTQYARCKQNAKKSDQVVREPCRNRIETCQHAEENYHRQKILEYAEKDETRPDSKLEVFHVQECERFGVERKRQHYGDNNVVTVEKKLERR